ncbi:hypothetical protein OG948_37175 (plasmid) [Embleya sp. NBC_00888]|nr:hypothetical protein OG948_37175 [Embleya sp. NBC_00888]
MGRDRARLGVGDERMLDDLWTDEVLADLGADWGGFEFASGVGSDA